LPPLHTPTSPLIVSTLPPPYSNLPSPLGHTTNVGSGSGSGSGSDNNQMHHINNGHSNNNNVHSIGERGTVRPTLSLLSSTQQSDRDDAVSVSSSSTSSSISPLGSLTHAHAHAHHSHSHSHSNGHNSNDSDISDTVMSSMSSLAAEPLRVFIGNLRDYMSEGLIREYFHQYGDITDIYFPKKKDHIGHHCGYGFVTFARKFHLSYHIISIDPPPTLFFFFLLLLSSTHSLIHATLIHLYTHSHSHQCL
jgi:hypothetical protein